MEKSKPSVVMICSPKSSSFYVCNGIKDDVDINLIIYEHRAELKDKIGKLTKLLTRRAKRLGWKIVAGQIAFKLYEKFYIKRISKKRMEEIIQEYQLDSSAPVNIPIKEVSSVNDESIIGYINDVAPDAVLVNGTGILPPNIIKSIKCPIINTHIGITPQYRGSHGGYWALANDDRANCGVTVHLIDEGIDTGGVLYQERLDPVLEDNFTTYPTLQIAAAIPLIKKSVYDVFNESLKVQETNKKSGLWTHPTLFQYIKTKKVKGVK